MSDLDKKQDQQDMSDKAAKPQAQASKGFALPDTPSLASATSDSHTTEQNSFVSKGEKVHKWGSYLGVDWIFNTITGVSFAYWGKYTDLGKKIWSQPVTKAFETALKPLIKNEAQLAKSAGYGNMFMSIIAGGMFTIPPLMALENNKVKKSMVQFFDEKIYGKEKVENDPKFAKSYEEIENAPPKDFTSGLTSRFVALAPLLALVLIPTTKKISNKVWFDHVENASSKAFTKAGITPHNMFKNVDGAQAAERWKFIHESVAMDAGLGIPYAILHAIFYNKFASKKDAAQNSEKHNSAETTKAPDTHETPKQAHTQPAKNWTQTVARKETPKIEPKSGGYVEQALDRDFGGERQLV